MYITSEVNMIDLNNILNSLNHDNYDILQMTFYDFEDYVNEFMSFDFENRNMILKYYNEVIKKYSQLVIEKDLL